MKNTVEAVKYGIETLRVSPNEMFSLIESSQGYVGDDYRRWLSNEIIKIAEKDGIGFSQLLVKKLSIVSSIMENVDVSIKPVWVKVFRKLLSSDTIVSVNFDEVGAPIEGFDWYSGVDLMFDKGFYNRLPKYEGTYAFVAKLESDACDKSSELFRYAKEYNIAPKNKGSLLLLRMCNYVEANDIGSDFKFAFFVNTGFLTDIENSDVISFFLRYFNYEGFVVDSSELLTDVAPKNQYAYVVCSPRGIGTVSQPCFVLAERAIKDNKVAVVSSKKRYSRGLLSAYASLPEEGKPLGSLLLGKTSLSAYNTWDKGKVITDLNFKESVVLYGVWWSMKYGGFSTDIKELLTGSQDFEELYYNCLPLFLFNTDSHFGGAENVFDVTSSDFIIKELEAAEVHFCFEAKELMTVCKGFLDYCGEEVKGKTFEEIRVEANHDGLNTAYLTALSKLKEYICSAYRRMG